MAIRIGSNTTVLRCQRSISQNASDLTRAFERLSSGQRINRAADDAAGLAISQQLKVNSRVYAQAVRNINDGISMFTIASGASGELKGVLLRLRELAGQASNGSYSMQQRLALDQEAKLLQAEYNRIIRSSEYNGRLILDESQGPVTIQTGYGTESALAASADINPDYAAIPVCASTSSSGAPSSGGWSDKPQITPDGRYVVFDSTANNLVSGDTNGARDVFLKDLLTGGTTRVSTNSTGSQIFGSSYNAQITPDGRYVFFYSDSTMLVSGDTNANFDIFRKDLYTGEVIRVNTSSTGAQASGSTTNFQITPDGRYVVFESTAANLVSGDTNAKSDVFLKDLETGTLDRISTGNGGAESNGDSSQPEITPDGRYVAFYSGATNLVSGDTNGQGDVFLRDILTGTVTRINTTSSGAQGTGGSSYGVKLTSDERYAVFTSMATNLVSGGDANFGQPDIFRKDLLTGEIKLANTSSSGVQASNTSQNGAISADGRFVVFSSAAANLVSGDGNATFDIFVKDFLTGQTRRISTDANGGDPDNFSDLPRLTADGRYVVFRSRAGDLAGGDGNGQDDIFVFENPLAEQLSLNLLSGISLQTVSGARYAQTFVDEFLGELGSFQAQLGSVQNRLEATGAVLSAMNENCMAADARIVNVDIAEESAEMVKTRIIQNVATSILAQANQVPLMALALLEN